MSFRRSPRTVPEHIAYIYELLRRTQRNPRRENESQQPIEIAKHNILSKAHADTDPANTKTDGDVLTWDQGSQLWRPQEVGVAASFAVLMGRASINPTGSGQSIPNNTVTVVIFDTEDFDDDDMIDIATAPTLITVRTAGRWLYTGGMVWATNATGRRLLEYQRNATTGVGVVSYPTVTGGASAGAGRTSVLAFSVGQTLRARVLQDSGGALTLTSCDLQMMRLRA